MRPALARARLVPAPTDYARIVDDPDLLGRGGIAASPALCGIGVDLLVSSNFQAARQGFFQKPFVEGCCRRRPRLAPRRRRCGRCRYRCRRLHRRLQRGRYRRRRGGDRPRTVTNTDRMSVLAAGQHHADQEQHCNFHFSSLAPLVPL